MACRINRNLERRAEMARRREEQSSRRPGFTPVMKTRGTVWPSQTIEFRRQA